LQWNKGDNSIN